MRRVRHGPVPRAKDSDGRFVRAQGRHMDLCPGQRILTGGSSVRRVRYEPVPRAKDSDGQFIRAQGIRMIGPPISGRKCSERCLPAVENCSLYLFFHGRPVDNPAGLNFRILISFIFALFTGACRVDFFVDKSWTDHLIRERLMCYTLLQRSPQGKWHRLGLRGRRE